MPVGAATRPDSDPPVRVAVNNPVAKEPKADVTDLRCGAGAMGSSRHVAGRTATTTSENLDVTAGETAPNSLSDGADNGSLPSKDGESEPAVMLACAPSGNDARPELAPSSEGRASNSFDEYPEIPEFLDRRKPKVAA
jgi:hypothetical protein